MEPEILFRGKRLDNGEWVYGCLVENDSDVYRAYIVVAARWETDEDGDTDTIETTLYEVDPATVGQYTGLTDNNGVKIFVGDIVRNDEPGDPSGKYIPVFGVVKFGEYTVYWKTRCRFTDKLFNFGFFVEWKDNEDDDYSRTYRMDFGYWVSYPYFAVCGNIHDNPKLLEVRNDTL